MQLSTLEINDASWEHVLRNKLSKLATCFMLVSCRVYSSIMKMEEIYSSETSFGPHFVALVRDRIIPSDRRLSVKLVPTFSGYRVLGGQHNGLLHPYSRFSRPECL
jgi:hypothetical protein